MGYGVEPSDLPPDRRESYGDSLTMLTKCVIESYARRGLSITEDEAAKEARIMMDALDIRVQEA